jgi:glycosyltransferase involved in cell wall biosynthesis
LRISIITCSIDVARYERMRQSLSRQFLNMQDSCEWIRIDDARSMCEGYNRGVVQSSGDVLIFCHDDIEYLSPQLVPSLEAHLIHLDVVGVAGATRLVNGAWYDAGGTDTFGQIVGPNFRDEMMLMEFGHVTAQSRVARLAAIDGVFMAMHRRVAEHVGFDAHTFAHFHGYDVDFSFRASQLGYNVGVAFDILLHHYSKGDWSEPFKQTLAAFASKHAGRLSQEPAQASRARYTPISTPGQALELLRSHRTS